MRVDAHQGVNMSNRMKLPLALIFASLILGGCMRVPDDLPPLATVVAVGAAPLV
jgi:hypothetical protein